MDELTEPFPDLTFPSDVASTFSVLREDLRNIVKSYKSQFILGEKDIDASWDQYLSDLEKAGVERFVSIAQDAYDSYLSVQ